MPGTDILAGVTVALDGDYETPQTADSGDEWISSYNATWTVTATGTADGMALKTATAGGAGSSATCILANASGTVLRTSNEVVLTDNTWIQFDFTDISVTLNDEVQLWFALTAYYDINTDGGSFTAVNDISGSYATPPTTLDNTANFPGDGIAGIRLMGTVGGGGGVIQQAMHHYTKNSGSGL